MKFEIEINDISHAGSGVGKHMGKVIFVPYTCLGEKVEVEVVKENSSFCIGQVCKIIDASADRRTPPCPYFTVCGGCDFQHMTRESEIAVKNEILRKEFEKVGYNKNIDIHLGKKRLGYRNKLALKYNGGFCFSQGNSHKLVEIKNCLLADESLQRLFPILKKFLHENHINNLTGVTLRKLENEMQIYLIFDRNFDKNCIKLTKNLDLSENFRLFGVFNNNETIFLNGSSNEISLVENFKMQVDGSSFLQVNDEVAKELYDEILNRVSGQFVVNAYSGQGLLTALIARNAKHVWGIEICQNSHNSAQQLKKLNQIFNMTNLHGKVEDNLGKLLLSNKIDCIVLDPARAGCSEKVLNYIEKSSIKKVVYVSCNFSTLVRDLKRLKGYKIEYVKGFDMFPNTANVEVMVILNKIGKK